MLLGYFTRYLPYGYRSVSSTLIQVHPELEESSLMSRANWFQTFRRITIPLLKPGMVAGWILLFISFFRELNASILLYTPGNEVISVAMFDMWESGEFRHLSAVAIIIIIVAILALFLVRKFSGVDVEVQS
jgi:iron(III) transport system permease protein